MAAAVEEEWESSVGSLSIVSAWFRDYGRCFGEPYLLFRGVLDPFFSARLSWMT